MKRPSDPLVNRRFSRSAGMHIDSALGPHLRSGLVVERLNSSTYLVRFDGKDRFADFVVSTIVMRDEAWRFEPDPDEEEKAQS